jgi:hypothetical protein
LSSKNKKLIPKHLHRIRYQMMADGRSIKQEVPHPNSGLHQQKPVESTSKQQQQRQTSTQANILSSKLSSELPQTNTYQNHSAGDFALSQTVGLSKSSSIGDMDDHEELFGERILQNRHVAFPPDHMQQVATQNNVPLPTIDTTQYQQQQQHVPSKYTQPQTNNLSSEQQDGTTRTLQRNHSLPIPPTLPVTTTSPPPPIHVNHQQHPPSPSNDATQRVMQLPGAAVQVSLAVDTTASTTGQVVTKKKGRFKFVEQLPIQRLSNDNLMNESNVESNQQQQQQQQVPNSIPSSSSSVNLQVIPPPPSQSQLPPPGSQSTVHEGQSQMITTTPNVQKKGRFVVTTLPAPTTLNNGSATTTATIQQHLLTQQQQQQHQHHPVVETIMQQSQSIPSHQIVDNAHVRRASDMGSYPVTSLTHTTTMPFLSNVAPPLPLPTIATTNNGQNIGYNGQHPITNVDSSSQLTSQTLLHPSMTSNSDDALVQMSAVHYDTIQSTSSSSSRQTSPKTVPKPNVTARHNTTGATSNPTMSSTTSSFVSTSTQQQRQQNQPIGFGKMLYFLDQMKLEVTEADQSIKSLQTDMKCLVRFSLFSPEFICLLYLETYTYSFYT